MSSSSDASSDEGVSVQNESDANTKHASAYWKQSLATVLGILFVWAFISLGCGVWFREWLDVSMPNVGGAPFGFWMAQQGSIIGFLILLFVYMFIMNRIDKQHGYGEGEES